MQKILSDGSVWLSIGLLCFTLNFALDRYGSSGALWDFAHGLFIGLSIAAFIMSIVLNTRAANRKDK